MFMHFSHPKDKNGGCVWGAPHTQSSFNRKKWDTLTKPGGTNEIWWVVE